MNSLNEKLLEKIIQDALDEDIGSGDITTRMTIPPAKQAKAIILAKDSGILCGLEIARRVLSSLDKNLKFKAKFKDGERIKKGDVLAEISARASSLLTAERTALNFLSTLSGIATQARKFVDEIKGCHAFITDTRKTIPGLRELEKYAVRAGRGHNHRLRLDEMVMIKDNHLKVISGAHKLGPTITHLKQRLPKSVKIEIEVTNLKEFAYALKVAPDIIMLDNMAPSQIKKAVALRGESSRPLLEISGNINLGNVRKYARTGADYISVGALTKEIKPLDISLEIT